MQSKCRTLAKALQKLKWSSGVCNPGDTVTEDQILADVMTDKATIEIPSPVAGTVLALGGKAGELMAVGAELIRIEVEGKGNIDGTTAPAAAAQIAAPPMQQVAPR